MASLWGSGRCKCVWANKRVATKLFFLRFYFNQAVKCFILCIGGFFPFRSIFESFFFSFSCRRPFYPFSLSLSLSLLHPRSACLLGRLAAWEWVCLTSQLRHQTKQAHDKAQGLVPCEEAWAPKMNACQIIKVNRQNFSQTRTWRKKNLDYYESSKLFEPRLFSFSATLNVSNGLEPTFIEKRKPPIESISLSLGGRCLSPEPNESNQKPRFFFVQYDEWPEAKF